MDTSKMSRREQAQVRRALGAPPSSLAEWSMHRRTWPGPYRLPRGECTWLCMMRARAIEDARMVARVAPWRYFTDVRA